MNIREVYVPVGTEVVDKVPVSFIEFTEFWNTHTTDEGFVMLYLNENNKIVD